MNAENQPIAKPRNRVTIRINRHAGMPSPTAHVYESALLKVCPGITLMNDNTGKAGSSDKIFEVNNFQRDDFMALQYGLIVFAELCNKVDDDSEVIQKNLSIDGGISNVKQLYYTILIFRELGVTDEHMASFIPNITHDPKYLLLLDEKSSPEYFWFLDTVAPMFVDWGKLFFNGVDPFIIVTRLLKVDQVMSNPALKVSALKFFMDMNFAALATHMDERVVAKIEDLTRQRRKLWQSLLIDPYTMQDFLTYSGPYAPENDPNLIKSNRKATHPPAIGSPVITSKIEAYKRFHDFTNGIFKKSQNPDYVGEFPWEHAVIAGGSVNSMLSGAPLNRSSDVDIFVVGRGDKKVDGLRSILRFFYRPPTTDNRPSVYYTLKNTSVIEIRIVGMQRVFQVILMDAVYPLDIIGRFDLTHISCCYYMGTFYMTPHCVNAFKTKVSCFNNMKNLRPERLAKTLNNGYDIIIRDTDVTPELTAALRDTHSELHMKARMNQVTIFTLEHDTELTPEEETLKNIVTIQKFVGQNFPTFNGFEDLFSKALFANFELDYVCAPITSFGGDMVANVKYNGNEYGKNEGMGLKSFSRRALTLVTSTTEVVGQVEPHDTGAVITLKDKDMLVMVNKVVAEVFPKYPEFANGSVDSGVSAEGVFKITFTNEQLTPIAKNGKKRKSACRTITGEHVNVEEDLKPGPARLLFTLGIWKKNDKRVIKIIPKALIISTLPPQITATAPQPVPVTGNTVIKPDYLDI